MPRPDLRDLLNAARWRDGDIAALTILVRHRGAPDDERAIAGERILAVRGGGIALHPESADDDSIFVPYHRFLAVTGRDGAVLWRKLDADPGDPDPRDAAVGDADEGARAAVRRLVAEAGVRADVVASVVSTDAAAPVASVASVASQTDAVPIVPTISVVLREASASSPLVLDGSAGEGGGQILRSSLALSIVTGTPFVLERIRGGRSKPGLLRQHLTSVEAAARICDAEVEGAALGSSRLVFRPGEVRAGDHALDIGSAGSTSLVLQTIALPLALATSRANGGRASRVTVRGGTHTIWAPPHPFLANAWLPIVRRMGADVELSLDRAGFYPGGGGEVTMTIHPSAMRLAPLHVAASGVLSTVAIHADVGDLPPEVGARAIAAASAKLDTVPHGSSTTSFSGAGPGGALWLRATDEGTGAVNVFSAIFERGIRAEILGAKLATDFLAWRVSGTSFEEHLSDQILLPIALAGEGSFTCNVLSLHALTNIEVIAAFTGRRLEPFDLGDGQFRIALRRAPDRA